MQTDPYILVAIFVAAAVLTGLLILLLIRSGWAYKWLDVPVDRSLHAVPTPRVGGMAMWVAVTIVCVVAGVRLGMTLWLSLLAVFVISVLDDRRALPASVRLAVHLLAAGFSSYALLGTDVWLVPAVLCMAWMANLYNFMDGADGLAGGMTAIGFAALGILAGMAQHSIALPALAIAGAALGFLAFNFPPARLFMGDAGSVPLGFAAAVLGLWGLRDGVWTVWVPLLAFAPFVLDASFTLILRVLKGKKPWEAHREHLYQHCVLRGMSHRRLVFAAYPMMLGCAVAGMALAALPMAHQQLVGPAACLLLATVYVVLRWRVARTSATHP